MNPNSSNKNDAAVSSKPPIDKKVYKLQQKQTPIYQSWLYKRKSQDKIKQHPTIIRTINSKWQRYWCILMKDYIIFNRHPDDKTPKDYLLLKDFEVQRTSRQYGFIVVDTAKDMTHEFYADTCDEYKSWQHHLFDLRIKLSSKDYSTPESKQQLLPDDLIKFQTNQMQSVAQSNNSSRESSPGASSSKLNSRDSSPILNYHREYIYMHSRMLRFTNASLRT